MARVSTSTSSSSSVAVAAEKVFEDATDSPTGSLVYYRWTSASAPRPPPQVVEVEEVPPGDSTVATQQKSSPYDTAIKHVMLVFHGLHAHGRYATVKYFVEATRAAVKTSGESTQSTSAANTSSVEDDYCFYSLDLPGHGDAKGLRGFMQFPGCVHTLVQAVQRVRSWHPNAKIHLAGSSLGGALALAVAISFAEMKEENKEQDRTAIGSAVELASLLLVAPLVQIRNPPAAPVIKLLRVLAWFAPSLALLSSSASDPAQQYRDPERRKEAVEDVLQYNGRIRLASAESCFLLTQYVEKNAKLLRLPVLNLIAENETVVDAEAARGLLPNLLVNVREKKTHMCLKALHGIFCEPEDALIPIQDVIREWLTAREGGDGAKLNK
ncbi:unnamed protein product [Amoebophrya sp. A120]|nr:unnamed protein product [Amoebophrya sp. A120]|eukprot:GSA120T00011193001.1